MIRRTLFAIGATAAIVLLPTVASADTYPPDPIDVGGVSVTVGGGGSDGGSSAGGGSISGGADGGVDVAGDSLSATGATAAPLLVGAAGLVLVGSAGVVAARRRRAEVTAR